MIKFTVDQCMNAHKKCYNSWPYFNEPRRTWTDANMIYIEYVRKDDFTVEYFSYSIENYKIVWG